MIYQPLYTFLCRDTPNYALVEPPYFLYIASELYLRVFFEPCASSYSLKES